MESGGWDRTAWAVDKDVPSAGEVGAGGAAGRPWDLESEEMSSSPGLVSSWSPVPFSGPRLCRHTGFYF